MTIKRPARLAVINSHPIQYFAPLYAYLNAAPDIDPTVLYLSDFSLRGAVDREFGAATKWDIDLLGGYRTKFIGSNWQTAKPYGFFALRTWAIFGEISPKRYDAVWLHGHGYAAYMIALLAARLKGVPVFMRSDAHPGFTQTRWKAALRRPALKLLYRQCAGLLAIGTVNRRLYKQMGVPDAKISFVPYVVDNDRFATAAKTEMRRREEWRARLGITDSAPIVLFASKFMRRKCPDDLLAAFLRLRNKGLEAHLVFVGSGEMETELRALAAGDANVHFPGFFNQGELPGVFAASDVFVLPSRSEPWGLIVNEVMNAGLPVIVAQEVGAAPDLVHDGVNGMTYAAGDVDALAASLDAILDNPEARIKMGNMSRKIIAEWNFKKCLEGVRQALNKIQVPVHGD